MASDAAAAPLPQRAIAKTIRAVSIFRFHIVCCLPAPSSVAPIAVNEIAADD